MSVARFPTGITLHQKSRVLQTGKREVYLARLTQAGASRDA